MPPSLPTTRLTETDSCAAGSTGRGPVQSVMLSDREDISVEAAAAEDNFSSRRVTCIGGREWNSV